MNIIRSLWATNPVRVTAVIVAVVVFLAAKLGLVVDEQSAGAAIALIIPVLLGGEVARATVSPAVPPIGDDSDALLAQQLVRA